MRGKRQVGGVIVYGALVEGVLVEEVEVDQSVCAWEIAED